MTALAEHPARLPPTAVAERRQEALRRWLPLVFVFVVALALRAWGLNWSLPWVFHPDEKIYAERASTMVRSGDPNPGYFKNPSLVTYLIAGELLVTRALGPLAGPLTFGAPAAAYSLGRLNSAVLGAAGVALLCAIGTTLFGRTVGLAAAALLATSFLHARDSHFGVSDVPALTLLLLSIYGSARVMREPRLRWYLLAGFAGGLATSAKYNMGFFFVPLVAASWLASRARSTHVAPSAAPLACLAAAALVSLLGYLMATPYTLLDLAAFRVDFSEQYGFGDRRWLGQPLEPVPLLYLTSLLQGFGALPLALAGVGAVMAWMQRRPELIFILAYPVVYLTYLLPKALFFARFALPIVPFLCLLSAYAVWSLASRLPQPSRGAALVALLAAALIQPLQNLVWHNHLLGASNTRVLSNQWIQANLPSGSLVAVQSYSLSDESGAGRSYVPNTARLRFVRLSSSEIGRKGDLAADDNVDYIVTSSFFYQPFLLDPPTRDARNDAERYIRLQSALESEARLVAHFGPGVNGASVPYSQDNVTTPFWNVLMHERTGPSIHIYALPRDAGSRSVDEIYAASATYR